MASILYKVVLLNLIRPAEIHRELPRSMARVVRSYDSIAEPNSSFSWDRTVQEASDLSAIV
jgi:hypothetical protein